MKWLAAACALFCLPAFADPIRIATYNTELSRAGPGLLLRDIDSGQDAQVSAVIRVIVSADADVIALQGVDWDYDNLGLRALERRLALAGSPYPYLFALQPNSGLPTGLDLDGDGRLGGAGDSQGYGDYTGRAGIAVLSRFAILEGEVLDLSPLLWKDLPGAMLPTYPDGSPFPSPEAQAVQRLSSTAHWVVPIRLPSGARLDLMTFQAAPPLFDGPEDRNGRRNHDEIRLWQLLLDGDLAPQVPRYEGSGFVIAGGANLDPDRGEGLTQAIAELLRDPRLTDPLPASQDAGTATVEWENAGRMRVDYVLPSAELTVLDSGVLWSRPDQNTAAAASRHRLVWVDIEWPGSQGPETD